MKAKARWLPYVAAAIFLSTTVPISAKVYLGRQPGPVSERQIPFSTELDRALRSRELDKARLLVPENWAAAERLFISYLEQAFISPGAVRGEPDPKTLARRLAEVLFLISQYDSDKAAVDFLENADPSTRQKLIEAMRDEFLIFEKIRNPRIAVNIQYESNAEAAAERRSNVAELLKIADRYHELSFPRGEYYALETSSTGDTARLNQLAQRLGDELTLIRRSTNYEQRGATGERLGLLKLQYASLRDMAPQLAKAGKLEEAAACLEKALDVARNIPPLETMSIRTEPARPLPYEPLILSQLRSVYLQMKKPEKAQQALEQVIAVSRPYGVEAELYVLRMMSSLDSLSRGHDWEVADMALQLAYTTDNRKERAGTLVWYSRARLTEKKYGEFPIQYDQSLQLCLQSDEVDLTVEALANRAECLAGSGNAARAKEVYDQSLRLVEQTGNLPKAAQAANRAGQSFNKLDAEISFDYHSQAIETAKRSGDWRLTLQWATAAANDFAQTNRQAAMDFFGQAAEACEKAGDFLELAKILASRAPLSPEGSPQRLQDLQQAVTKAHRHTEASGYPAFEVERRLALATELLGRGEYLGALDIHLRNIEVLRTAADPPDSAEFARQTVIRPVPLLLYWSHVEAAKIYTLMAEPSQAIAAADQASRIFESSVLPISASGTQQIDIASEFNHLGIMYWALGQNVPAMEHWSKALEKRATGKTKGDFSINNNRAQLYIQLGDYETALWDWDEVAKIHALRDSPTPWKAEWLGNAARINALAGDFDRALSLAREAIEEENRPAPVAAAPTVTKPLPYPLAGSPIPDSYPIDILLSANLPEEALAFCNQRLEKARRLKEPLWEKLALEQLARVQVKSGRFDEARKALLAAAELGRDNAAVLRHGGPAASLLALGNLELEAKNYSKAREHLLAARTAVNPYDRERIWQIERALALTFAAMRDTETAKTYYENAFDALDALESVGRQLRPEEFRMRYDLDRYRIYDEYAGLLAARAAESGLTSHAEQAFQAAERKRSQVLRNLLATGWSNLPAEAIPEQLRRVFEMEDRIGAKQKALLEQSGLPQEKRNAALVERLQGELARIREDHSRLLTSVAQGQYRYTVPGRFTPSMAAPVRAALGPSRALLEYLVMEDRSYAYVVSAAGVHVVPLPLGREEIRDQVQHLMQPFRQLRSGAVDLARLAFDTRAAYTLHQAIFAPVERFLGQTSEILVVPDDLLNYFPFDLLVDRVPQASQRNRVLHAEYADTAFLLRRYTISYLTSAGQLMSNPSRAATAVQKRLLALANPAAGVVQPSPVQDDPLKRQLRSADFRSYLGPIPGSGAEVESIARNFDKNMVTLLIGAEATETAYDALAGKHAIIHFATHAVASDSQPLYSTMILAPDAAAGQDGFLQAYEVLRQPIRADLVVLSGCETALGAQDWGQGLVGLVAAFQQAGAQSVLATLWSIDESTAEFMAGFYRSMAEGMSTPAALRKAKLQFLQKRVRLGNVEVSLAHPFFWAPFVLVGAPPVPPVRK
jgi:CHAT domain-containing protein